MSKSEYISIKVKIKAQPLHVWNAFTQAKHVVHWNYASPEWHCPKAKATVKVGGTFDYRMEARDGSFGFNLKGSYTAVEPHTKLDYTLEDGRLVEVSLENIQGKTLFTQRFQPESENSLELQKTGWQAILKSFKQYVETAM